MNNCGCAYKYSTPHVNSSQGYFHINSVHEGVATVCHSSKKVEPFRLLKYSCTLELRFGALETIIYANPDVKIEVGDRGSGHADVLLGTSKCYGPKGNVAI
jgi:hypothetical protein